ncbi:hypothetical protein OIU74_026175 [Salix koriyanagi]|uniref:Uncharacterized protein n=1 Tax=Salix koriyanagi TaxID=2511006 RepID=A0A9Q0VYE0_9ROSI|nr:hypothetical protein OIU74_026175 [Salix koriyanagi]
MAFAAPAPAAAHARQPVPKKPTSNKQPAPMVEAVTADVWQPVPRKHISNRLPKSGTGIPSGLALGKANVAFKVKRVEVVDNESIDNGLMASGNIAASSSMAAVAAGRGCSSSFSCGSLGHGSGSIFNGYFGC